jgi:membrane protein
MGKLRTFRTFLVEVYQVWAVEKPNQLVAALAYFGVFSFAPVIYIAYWLAGLFIDEAAAAERLYERVETALGPETAAFIRDSVKAVSTINTGGSWIITLVSLGTLLFAAIGLFLQLKYALNRIWGVPLIDLKDKFAFMRQELFAFLMVIALGLLVILVTVVNVIFTSFGSIIEEYTGKSNRVSILYVISLLAVVVLANALIYKVLPDVKLAWRDVWPGSIIVTFLMVIGGLVIGIYFRLGGVHSAFEVAGAFAVLMIAIYYFAQIFLFGAIITRVYAHQHGSMRKSLVLQHASSPTSVSR